MITFCSSPKAMRGNIGTIQTNAIASWKCACPNADVVLFGTEEGTKNLSDQWGAQHIPHVGCSQDGSPLFNEMIAETTHLGKHPNLCFVNCDILLPPNITDAISAASRKWDKFLIVGQCHNADITQRIAFPKKKENIAELLEQIYGKGTIRGIWGIDYFIFPKHTFGEIPPFSIGRAGYDDWMVYQARTIGTPVLNATAYIHAIHQNHDYAHIEGGLETAYRGAEAKRNYELAGGFQNLYSVREASHVMTADGEIRRNLEGLLLSHMRRVQQAGSRGVAH